MFQWRHTGRSLGRAPRPRRGRPAPAWAPGLRGAVLLLLSPSALAVAPVGPTLSDPGLHHHGLVEVPADASLTVTAGLPRIGDLRAEGPVVIQGGALTVDRVQSTLPLRVEAGSLALGSGSGDVVVTGGALTLAPGSTLEGAVHLQGGLLAASLPARVAGLQADADSEIQLVGAAPLEVVGEARIAGRLVCSPQRCGEEMLLVQAGSLAWSGTAEGATVVAEGSALRALAAPCDEATVATAPPAAGCGCITGSGSPPRLLGLLALLALSRRRS